MSIFRFEMAIRANGPEHSIPRTIENPDWAATIIARPLPHPMSTKTFGTGRSIADKTSRSDRALEGFRDTGNVVGDRKIARRDPTEGVRLVVPVERRIGDSRDDETQGVRPALIAKSIAQ
jgi:hypothetical protein